MFNSVRFGISARRLSIVLSVILWQFANEMLRRRLQWFKKRSTSSSFTTLPDKSIDTKLAEEELRNLYYGVIAVNLPQ